ncbi:MAG TPA: type II CAAX endopeptidase family protein [Gemmatimonadaceae bacterium]|nr:type II CAAX endopeptidase family protein [Gemmatimonadaceae bacterium]
MHDALSRPPDDGVAARLRGFGPVGILAMLAILAGNLVMAPLSAVLVVAWARRSCTPWRDIGYVRPRSWIGDAVIGIVFGSALKLLMKAVVMPLLGADPINQAYHYLVGNRAALPGMVFAVTVGAGWGEETLFRGYLFERLGRLFGNGRGARVAIVLLTAAVFGLAHYFEQGLPGVQQGMIVGLVFGTIYAIIGRLWMLMWAHAAFDLTALAIIYWDLETAVARLIFS